MFLVLANTLVSIVRVYAVICQWGTLICEIIVF